MRCVTIDGSGFLVDVTPQPVDMSSCALVVQSGGELGNNPFNLSAADGGSVALAVLLVWGSGFVWRVLVQSLQLFDKDNHHE